MPLAILGLIWLPYFDGQAEVTHDLGTNPSLRGTIELSVDLGLVESTDWRLDAFTAVQTYVRDNHRSETPFRISPQQVHYPVGARLRWRLTDKTEWGLVAFHQSNHDVDTNDEQLNRETISYEVYGAEYARPEMMARLGLYYDRGTRLDGTLQNWPFNYYLAGLRVQGEWPAEGRWYLGGRGEVIGHRNPDTPLAYVSLGGHLTTGARFHGQRGVLRVFIRVLRLTDYPYLGAPARHQIGAGISIGARNQRWSIAQDTDER